MSRQQREPLRSLQDTERVSLVWLSRSASAPAAQVTRARALLAVAEGLSYTAAAQLVGRHTGDTVARWVAGFNHAGLAAVVPRQGGGQPLRYGEVEQRRILAEIARPPDRVRGGTASWSLSTLRTALRQAPDGLPGISTYTIGRTLHAAGFGWQKSRTWCETGVVVRKRKQGGLIRVTDPDAAAKRG
jgi:transposase